MSRMLLWWGFILLLIVSSGFPTFAQTCVQPPSGIIAWWPLDETSGTNAADIVGNNPGIYVNGPVPASGQVAGALRFDGNNDYVGAGDSVLWAFGSNDFTIELWANFDTPGGGSIGHPGDIFIGNDDGPGTQNKWFFALGGGVLNFHINGPSTGSYFLVRAPFSPTVGQWYHLAVTRNGSTYTIFVDGTAVGSETNSVAIPDASAPLTIGQAEELGFMNGRLDEVTIYHRALTQPELAVIASARSAGKCKALEIQTKSTLTVKLSDPFSLQLQAKSGQPPYSWSLVNGALPNGLNLSSDGVVSGTPTQAGDFTFTIKVTDSENTTAEKTFTWTVGVTLPPANIRIHKTGTVVVPGRIVDYFILVENKGKAAATNVEVVEILEPPAFFSLVSTTPAAQVSEESLVYWEIPSLQPEETKLLSYSVRLNPSVPLDTIVSGQACTKETGKSWEQIVGGIPKCTLLPECSIFFDENAGEFALCVVAKETCEKCDDLCLTVGGIKICAPIVYPACLAQCAQKVSICVQQVLQCQPNCAPAKCPAQAQAALVANGSQCAVCPSGCSCDDRPAIGAIDPNEKLVIAKRFIQPDQLLVYPVHFENIGTIEARDVFVTDVLDSNLDTSTLQILTPDGSFDAATRTVKWSLLNIDLQPQATGNVLLSIKPKPNLPSGTEIRNKARIQFEVFAPLDTNEVVNVIDSTRPTCTVNPLPATTSTPSFPISWSGTDTIGEIESYSVLVSVDGGSFTSFLDKTTDTSATFTGELGKTYGFLCIATDTAENIEVQDAAAETTTTITTTDLCPNDPNKTAPGVCGCGVADTDSDGDGTPNCNDQCPNDPNRTTPSVEVCNGLDDSCNGTVDDGFNVGGSCTVGIGACQRTGAFICSATGQGTQCNATAGTPSTEVCNGSDDDCDGSVDEGGCAPTCAANVSAQVSITRGGYRRNSATGRYVQQITLKNTGTTAIPGPVSLVLDTLSSNATLFSPTGNTSCATPINPYKNVSVGADNILSVGETTTIVLEFTNPTNANITYSTRVLGGPNDR